MTFCWVHKRRKFRMIISKKKFDFFYLISYFGVGLIGEKKMLIKLSFSFYVIMHSQYEITKWFHLLAETERHVTS